MYRRAHCCNNIASNEQERVITKLKDQSEFTQTVDLGGEKVGGLDRVEEAGTSVLLESARS